MTLKGIVIINSIYKITSKIVSKFSTHVSQPQNEFQGLWLNVSATLATYIYFSCSFSFSQFKGSTLCTKLLSGIISMQSYTCCTFMVNLEDFGENFNYIQLLFLTSESKVCINFLYVPCNTLVFEIHF